MLSIKMAASGYFSLICRVASMPLSSGMAQSITVTRGRRLQASCTASWPSLASPTTEISSSSSSIRRKPRRTRAWSSTSRTVILCVGMALHFFTGNLKADEGAALHPRRNHDCPADKLRSLSHGNQPDSTLDLAVNEAAAMILDFEREGVG